MFLRLFTELKEHVLNFCSIEDAKNLACTSNEYNKALQRLLFHTIKLVPFEDREQTNLAHVKRLRALKHTKCLKISHQWLPSNEPCVTNNYSTILRHSDPVRLHMQVSLIATEMYNVISRLNNLIEVNLVQSQFITDENMRVLCEGLKKMRKLQLSSCVCLSDESMRYIGTVGQLTELKLNYSLSISDSGVGHLTSLPDLRRLTLQSFLKISDVSLALIACVSTLTELDVESNPNITDSGLQYLQSLQWLETLNLGGAEVITGHGLNGEVDPRPLCLRRSLQRLNLKYCERFDDEGLRCISRFTLLVELDLSYCVNITDSGLKHIKTLTSLQRLCVGQCKSITDSGVAHIAVLKCLTDLDLGYCTNITDDALRHVSKLKLLQKLVLIRCANITDRGVSYISDMTSLQQLDLGHCLKLTDTALQELHALLWLRKLNLNWCRNLSDVGLSKLVRLPRLTELNVTKCQVTDTGVKQFCRNLSPVVIVKH